MGKSLGEISHIGIVFSDHKRGFLDGFMNQGFI